MTDEALTRLHPDHIKVTRITYGLAALIPLVGAIILEGAQLLPLGLIIIPTLILCLLLVFILPARRYQYRGYHISADRLRVSQGHMLHSDTIVPFGRIQHIDVEQGPIQRRYDLATLSVHTAGNHNSTVSLPGLPHAEALAMRETIGSHIKREAP
jgi:uncharacterized protein